MYSKVKITRSALEQYLFSSLQVDFVKTPFCIEAEPPAKRDCQFSLMVCARGSPECLDFTRNTPQLDQLCPR